MDEILSNDPTNPTEPSSQEVQSKVITRHEDYDFDALVQVLADYGADNLGHTSRVLLTHLKGVYSLLKEWDNSPSLCLAGLFHSVYGTTFFKNVTIMVSERDKLRDLLGDYGEWLVYLFCACDRGHLVRQMREKTIFPAKNHIEEEGGACCKPRLRDGKDTKYELKDRFADEVVTLDWDTFRDLMELVLANWAEQFHNPHKGDSEKKKEASKGKMTKKQQEKQLVEKIAKGRENRRRNRNAWAVSELYLTPKGMGGIHKMFRAWELEIQAMQTNLRNLQEEIRQEQGQDQKGGSLE